MARRYCVAAFIAALLIPVVWAGGPCFSEGSQAARLRAFVEQPFAHGVPFKEAHGFSSDDDMALLACLLRDPAETAHAANITAVLGLSGNPNAAGPLIDFINHGEGELTSVQFAARMSAVLALGSLAAADRKALHYLLDHASPNSWEGAKLAWSAPGHLGIEGRDQELSKSALQALGLSGHPEAAKLLAQFKSSPPGPGSDWRDIATEALQANLYIHDHGLAQYYSRAQQ